MSVHALDQFLNNVFDIYAMPSFTGDFKYSKDEYYVTSDDKQYTLEMPMPGISKEDLKVDIEEGMLVVQATAKIKSKAVKNVKKSWYIDENIDTVNISAKLENGLLTVTLPRAKPNKKSIAVTVS
jgi:HSP20 family molecular chaperone IbpA